MQRAVAQFLTSGASEAVEDIFSIAKLASATQQVAIGKGLKNVVETCENQDSRLVKSINFLVSTSSQNGVKKVFFTSESTYPAEPEKDTGQLTKPKMLPQTLGSMTNNKGRTEPLPDPFGPYDSWN